MVEADDDAVIIKESRIMETVMSARRSVRAAEEVDLVNRREWSRGAGSYVECSVDARHGAGSGRSARKRTMSLYGNNGIQRHFLLSGRNVGARAPPSG